MEEQKTTLEAPAGAGKECSCYPRTVPISTGICPLCGGKVSPSQDSPPIRALGLPKILLALAQKTWALIAAIFVVLGCIGSPFSGFNNVGVVLSHHISVTFIVFLISLWVILLLLLVIPGSRNFRTNIKMWMPGIIALIILSAGVKWGYPIIHPPASFDITGRVYYEETQTPVADVNIQVRNADDMDTWTNEEGYFVIHNVSITKPDVIAVYAGKVYPLQVNSITQEHPSSFHDYFVIPKLINFVETDWKPLTVVSADQSPPGGHTNSSSSSGLKWFRLKQHIAIPPYTKALCFRVECSDGMQIQQIKDISPKECFKIPDEVHGSASKATREWEYDIPATQKDVTLVVQVGLGQGTDLPPAGNLPEHFPTKVALYGSYCLWVPTEKEK